VPSGFFEIIVTVAIVFSVMEDCLGAIKMVNPLVKKRRSR